MLAVVHLNKAKLIGPTKCIAYLDTIKFPDHITVEAIANKAPIWLFLLNGVQNFE